MKIKEWYETITEEEVREKALDNLREETADVEEPSLDWAIFGGFPWVDTPEGYDEWEKVYFGFGGEEIE